LVFATRYTLHASGTISAAIALLIKPTAIFFLAPVVGLYFWKFLKKEITIKKLFGYLFLVSCALLPLIMWRLWIAQFPEGIPASDWLFNGNGIRFKGSWWHWLFADRLGRLILGYWGLIPFGLGILSLAQFIFATRTSYFYFYMFVSCILFLVSCHLRDRQRPTRLLPNHSYSPSSPSWLPRGLCLHFH
jgi:hypothetical protein